MQSHEKASIGLEEGIDRETRRVVPRLFAGFMSFHDVNFFVWSKISYLLNVHD